MRGLNLDVREFSEPYGEGNRPALQAESNVTAHVTPTTGLATWFADLFEKRPADYVASDPDCYFREGADQSRETSDPCGFTYASLGWDRRWGGAALPGTALDALPFLSLVRSGDTLFALRPLRHQKVLDPADRGLPCTDPAGNDETCVLTPAMVQGFTNVELAIPVLVRSPGRSVASRLMFVPVGMSVEAFGRTYGRVRKIERSLQWLPEKIVFAKGPPRPREKFANQSGRVAISFVDARGTGASKGVTISGDQRKDILLAPGDLIVLAWR